MSQTPVTQPLFSLPHIEHSPKRVRVLFGGEYIVDTTKAKLVWEKPNYPHYFFDAEDVPQKFLSEAFQSWQHQLYDIVVGNRRAEAAATKHLDGELGGLISIDFGAMDAWLEEDERIFIHPKDPYKRVDVLQSSRHIRVLFNGVELANTQRPRLLFETSLRVRTYIPIADCRVDLLRDATLTTQCPYKGVANYYHVRLPNGQTEEDSVWWYRNPNPECIEIKGLLSFYDEKFDVYVDGVLQQR